MENKFKRTTVTSALPYANGPVHIGHVMRHKKEETDLFADETATDRDKVKPLSFEMYRKLIEQPSACTLPMIVTWAASIASQKRVSITDAVLS